MEQWRLKIQGTRFQPGLSSWPKSSYWETQNGFWYKSYERVPFQNSLQEKLTQSWMSSYFSKDLTYGALKYGNHIEYPSSNATISTKVFVEWCLSCYWHYSNGEWTQNWDIPNNLKMKRINLFAFFIMAFLNLLTWSHNIILFIGLSLGASYFM